MRPKNASLLAALFFAASPVQAEPSGDGGVVEENLPHPLGIVDHLNYDGVAGLEARWMRMPVSWRYIEPEDDNFNFTSGLDTWLTEAEARGINGSLVIACNQFWATGHTGSEQDWPSYPPLDLTTTYDPVFGYSESYYDFIQNLVTAYRGRIDRITIENEANTSVFWAGTSDDYRRLVATAAKAVEEHAPEILVFDSGVGSGSLGVAVAEWMIDSGTVPREEILQFVNDYYEYDVYAPLEFDSYEQLAYWLRQPFVLENNKKVDSMLGIVAPYVDGLNFKFTNSSWLMPTLVHWLDDRLTQYGNAIPLKVNNEASNWPRSSEADEARNLFRMLVEGLAVGVEQTIWFPYSDELTNTPRVGLLDENGQPTLQADAFQTLGSYLGSTHSFLSRDLLGENVHRFRFVADGDVRPAIDIMWWDDGGHGSGAEQVVYQLPEITESILRVEHTGSAVQIPIKGETYSPLVSENPRLYVYTFSEVSTPESAPAVPLVRQNAPNPFRASTTIQLAIPEALAGTEASLRVFNASGRLVRTLFAGSLDAGSLELVWSGRDDQGRDSPAGSYWYRLTTVEGTTSKRMLLVR